MRSSIKSAWLFAACALLSTGSRGQDTAPAEGRPEKVSLKPYSGGAQIGAIGALNEGLAEYSSQFLELSFIQQFEITPRALAFADLGWLLPDNNFGGLVGVDYLLAQASFRPFVGAGVGMYFFEKEGGLAEGFGPAATAHLGFLFDLMEELQLRVRAPFTFVLNRDRDMVGGLEIGVLFSSPLRRTRVEKL